MTTIQDCLEAVSCEFGVSVLDLRSDRRHAPVVRVRHLAFWLARHTTERSLPCIAKTVGRRDHTTIAHGIKQTDKRLADDPLFRAQAYGLVERLQPNE